MGRHRIKRVGFSVRSELMNRLIVRSEKYDQQGQIVGLLWIGVGKH